MLGKQHSDATKLKMRNAKLGKRLSVSTEFQKGVSSNTQTRLAAVVKGSSHWKWTDTPSYSAIHQWIVRWYGKPMQCEHCGIVEQKTRRMHWANVSGEYKRDISDWKRLCVVCHARLDKTALRGWITKRARALV